MAARRLAPCKEMLMPLIEEHPQRRRVHRFRFVVLDGYIAH
jgi:hypothetical protein